MPAADAADPASVPPMSDWLPLVLSAGCTLTARGGGFDGHIHGDHDEICLVANDGTLIRHGGVERAVDAGTVFLFRRGELHGYRNGPGQEPHLWLVHYLADEELYRECPRLAAADPEQRVWRLTRDQLAGYQGLFVRLQAELAGNRPGARAAAAAWLRLLLVGAARWSAADAPALAPPPHDPELMTLWEVINDHIERPADFASALRRRVPNYDSLRHRFRRIYACAPRDALLSLRMERAKHLLLESTLPVKDVAERLGYGRQHEFARAFAARVGRSPTAWRAQPG